MRSAPPAMKTQRRIGEKMIPRGLPRTEAAIYVGCKSRKFDYMVEDGRMPRPRMIDSKKVWDVLELNEFFDALPRAKEANDNKDSGSEWE